MRASDRDLPNLVDRVQHAGPAPQARHTLHHQGAPRVRTARGRAWRKSLPREAIGSYEVLNAVAIRTETRIGMLVPTHWSGRVTRVVKVADPASRRARAAAPQAVA